MKGVFILLAIGPCFGMSATCSRLLDQALAESEAELATLKAENRGHRVKAQTAFEDVTRPSGRKTASVGSPNANIAE